MMHDDDSPANCPDESSPRSNRDARGRWLKGHCPNPKGRPKKKPRWQTSTHDLRTFGNTLIDVRTNGKPELMLRRDVLLEKIFEEAMKGKVSMLKFLYQEFEKNDLRMAELTIRYRNLLRHWILGNPDFRTPGYELPNEVASDIAMLREFFDPCYPRTSGDDETDGTSILKRHIGRQIVGSKFSAK